MAIADTFERYMLELINQERAAVGAPPLLLEQNLNASADSHSAWMLETDIFSHTGVEGSSATQRMRDAGFDFSGGWRSAENIAVQSERGPNGIMDDVENLHTSLMNSPGHRANILNPDLDYIGIGIALGDFDFGSGTYESVIVTQNFASNQGDVDLDVGEPAPAPVAAVPVVNDVTVAAVQVEEGPTETETPPPAEPDPEPEAATPAQAQTPPPTPAPAEAEDPEPADEADDNPALSPPSSDTFVWKPAPAEQIMDLIDTLFGIDDDTDQGTLENPFQAACYGFLREKIDVYAALFDAVQSDELTF